MIKKLLFSVTKDDLVVTYFSGKGAGGQHRNRHHNCVRIKHPDSGALVTGQSHKERRSNIKEAMNNLVKDVHFKLWHNAKVIEILTGKSIDDIVDQEMQEKNLRIEYRVDGRWMKES